MDELSLQRRKRRMRCAYCHDDMVSERVSCPECETALHQSCWQEAVRCPSIGCGYAIEAAEERADENSDTISDDLAAIEAEHNLTQDPERSRWFEMAPANSRIYPAHTRSMVGQIDVTDLVDTSLKPWAIGCVFGIPAMMLFASFFVNILVQNGTNPSLYLIYPLSMILGIVFSYQLYLKAQRAKAAKEEGEPQDAE